MNGQGPDEELRLQRFLEPGSELAGSLTGAAVGMTVGGPAGALLGAAAQPIAIRALKRVISDLMGRQLSAREQSRAGAVAWMAAQRIQERMNQGYEPRHDDFRVGEPGHRSAAEEIAEGVLISAQREHEERKLPYTANLLASFAFEPAISRGEANLFLRLANDLSYRQLAVIAILSQKERFPNLRNEDYPNWPAGPLALIGILTEMAELVHRGMLSDEFHIIPTESGINPSRTQVVGWAGGLYRLMRLVEMPEEDLTQVARVLST